MAKKIALRLAQLGSSPNLKVLMQIPGPKCHALIGDREGEWAVEVSGNYRLIFEIATEPIPLMEDGGIDTEKITDIRIIRTEDYHK